MPAAGSVTTLARPLNLLESVNELLKAIGRDSIMSLSAADSTVEARQALEAISETSVEVQKSGWEFNMEEDYPLTPNTDGHILKPSNAAAMTPAYRSMSLGIVERGDRLYSRKNRTTVFTETVYVDVIWLFPYEDIPAAIRDYIVAQAGRRYGVSRAPDMNTYRFSSKVEQDAYLGALQYDAQCRLGKANPHFARMTRR